MRSPGGASYQVFTQNKGDKIKLNDVVTFQFIQKTDKDSVLMSSYTTGNKAQIQVVAPESVKDVVEINLMQILPLLTVKDSVLIKVPTDSLFKGHEEQRPPFFPKGSNLNFVLKIDRIQSMADAVAERNAAAEKVKADEAAGADKYIAAHKLIVKTTASGLKYVITQPSLKIKPLKGDTLLVNYAGRTLDDKLFDSSIESVAKAGGLNQPGRNYEPIQVVVGTGGVIPGWDEGLLLLNEGSKATFIIPSGLAYGAQGAGEDIKPNSTLVFDVEIVKLKPAKHGPGKGKVTEIPAVANENITVFNPYFGTTSKVSNFRSSPSAKGEMVKQFALNAKLYVLSSEDINGYCKAIDIKTGKVGWVSKSSIKPGEKAKPGGVSEFKNAGGSQADMPQAVLKNTTARNVTLIVGNDTFIIYPNSGKTVEISKGEKYYIISSPGAVPRSGFQDFVPGKKYELTF